MTKHLKKMLSLVLALALVLTLCVPSMDAQAAKKKAKTKLTINKKSITLVEGKKQQLTVKYGKKNVTKKAACKWSTKNKKVATVKKGKITAVGAGKTTIIAKYQKKTVKCTVIVKAKGGDNGQEGGEGDDNGQDGQGNQSGQDNQNGQGNQPAQEEVVSLSCTPSDGTIKSEGTAVQLNAKPKKFGSGTPSYQWYKDSNKIEGATQNTYYATEAGVYSCDVHYINLDLKSGTITVKTTVVSPATDVVTWTVEPETFPGNFAVKDPDGKTRIYPILLKREYVSFNPWPTSLKQVKYVINNCKDPFVIGALYVVAQSNYVYTSTSDFNCGRLAFDMLDQIQLGGGALKETNPLAPIYCVSNAVKGDVNASGFNGKAYKKDGKTLSTQITREYASRAFCKGATPENGYAPNDNASDINDKTKWKIKVDQYVYCFDQVDGTGDVVDPVVKSEAKDISVTVIKKDGSTETETETAFRMPALHKDPSFVTVCPTPYSLSVENEGDDFATPEHNFKFRIGMRYASKAGVWIPSDYVDLKDAEHGKIPTNVTKYNFQANGLFSNGYVGPEDVNNSIW
ncbi:MAG: Ig-like domain-containing protein [Lachnospiraceae bacterium]|nr:Ig-like domain-containing protein [Lachnospiraceae bacterium]